jgi:phosphotransacetylase
MDQLMGSVIAAYGESTASAAVVVVEGLLPTGGDSYLGVVNNELVKTLNAQVILVASRADKTIDQLDDHIEYAANAFGGLEEQVLVYGDCAVIPDPDAQTLADIALQSADSAAAFGIPPRVAMISYSTGESGSGVDVVKVREATKLAQKIRPDILIDGPLQ